MKFKSLTICLLLLLSFLIVPQALAVGLTVKPTSINMEAAKDKPAESELLIMNSYDEPASYRVFADEFSDKIIISPNRFKLYPGENQIVKLALADSDAGKIKTSISVVASPLAGAGLITSSGVKIPLTVSAPHNYLLIILLTALFFTACLILFFVVKLKKKCNANDTNRYE